MELRHLRYFTAVAEELNFRRAAARLHVTQPALSRQIRDLEQELGVELIIRTTSGVALSPAGKAFLAEARRILELSAEAALSMRKFAACRHESLDIGYIAPALGSFLTGSLQLFGQRHPKVKVTLFELSPARQIEALRDGRLDIALIGHSCGDLQKEFDLFEIRKAPLCVVLPESHRLASQKKIRLGELAKEPFIGLSEESFPDRNNAIAVLCRKEGFSPKFVAMADGLSSALALVGSGMGICLMPDEVEDLPHRHAVFRPLAARICIEFSAAVCAGEKRPLVRAILEEFRGTARAFDQ